MSVHKAEPTDAMQQGHDRDACVHCHEPINKVPGGHGMTWVHTRTGAVAQGDHERKTFTLVIAAGLVSETQQDAWDTWVELLRDPMFVENNTTVTVTA